MQDGITVTAFSFFFFFSMCKDILLHLFFRVKMISSFKVLFTVKPTFPHCLTVFLMKLCELIKYSSECLNKILKALLLFYALFEITYLCMFSIQWFHWEKTSFQFLSFFFFFSWILWTLSQFKEDCIVFLMCTDTRETVCSESIDGKYKKLGGSEIFQKSHVLLCGIDFKNVFLVSYIGLSTFSSICTSMYI